MTRTVIPRPKRRKVRRSWKISLPRTSAQFFGGSHASISEGVDSPSELPGLRVWHSKSIHQLQHQLVGRPVSAMAGGIGSHWQILDRLVWYLDCRGQQCRGYMPRAYAGAEEELAQGEVDAVLPETVGRLGGRLGVGGVAIAGRTMRLKSCVREDSPWELLVLLAF